MTDTSHRPRLRFFENSPGQAHIQGQDQYLYRQAGPDVCIAVVGTGTMGQEHMRVATLLGRATVHGIFDERSTSVDAALANHAQSGARTPRVYESLQAVADDSELDAIFICTPNHTHLAVLRELAVAGKPIFLEKPMATTLADGRELADLVRQQDLLVQVGLQYRYKAPYVEAWHELMERGSLGNLLTLSMSEYRPPFLDKVGQWNKFSSLTGGTLIEKCCHYFDLMQRFTASRPRRVLASGGRAGNFASFERNGEKADGDDHAFVVIDYENGVRGSFTLNMFSPAFHEELVLTGDQGRLVASERFDPQRPLETESRLRIETIEPAAARDSRVSYGNAIEQSGHHGATYHEHIAFLDTLSGIPGNAATIRDGLWSMVVASAAQQSINRGEAVAVSELVAEHQLGDHLL